MSSEIHDKRSLIVINSLDRSGGSLVARLFDGHAQLLVYPLDKWFSPNKQIWPTLDRILEEKDFDELVRAIACAENFKTLAELGTLKKDLYQKVQFSFDYQSFLKRLRNMLDSNQIWSCRNVFNAEEEAFFRTWLGDSAVDEKNVNYIVDHCAYLCFSPAQHFFDVYPDGYLIQTVRDPRGYYSSMKRLFDVQSDNDNYLEIYINNWVTTTVNAVRNQLQYPNRYIVICYEDLVRDPLSEMKRLCDIIGISYDPILAQPTINAQAWMGNSSYGSSGGAVQQKSIDAWKKNLTAHEIEYIEHATYDLMTLFNYRGNQKQYCARDLLVKLFSIDRLGKMAISSELIDERIETFTKQYDAMMQEAQTDLIKYRGNQGIHKFSTRTLISALSKRLVNFIVRKK